MNFMTQSKVIQQADQAEEFQENPHYYHRNIDPVQVNSEIHFISKDVNSFIDKLQFSNTNRYHISAKPQRNTDAPSTHKSKYHPNHTKNSEISQITSNTQSLIEDLSWMNSIKFISQPKPRHSDRTSFLPSQNSFAHGNSSLRKTTAPKNYSLSKVSSQNDSHQDCFQTNSKSVNVSRTKFQRQTKNYLPKTLDIFKKNLSNFNYPENANLTNVNKVYFDSKKKMDFLDEFDDKDTVVNEPHANGRRKLTKTKVKSDLKKHYVKQQSYEKLTKKKLLQKILQLQSSFEQLKNQQEIKRNSNFRQNQALHMKASEELSKNKARSIQDQEIIVNSKVGRKYTLDQSNLRPKMMQVPSKKNTFCYVEQDSQFRKTQAQSHRKKSSAPSYSQSKISKGKICDKEKISLTKWVSEVWDDF